MPGALRIHPLPARACLPGMRGERGCWRRLCTTPQPARALYLWGLPAAVFNHLGHGHAPDPAAARAGAPRDLADLRIQQGHLRAKARRDAGPHTQGRMASVSPDPVDDDQSADQPRRGGGDGRDLRRRTAAHEARRRAVGRSDRPRSAKTACADHGRARRARGSGEDRQPLHGRHHQGVVGNDLSECDDHHRRPSGLPWHGRSARAPGGGPFGRPIRRATSAARGSTPTRTQPRRSKR